MSFAIVCAVLLLAPTPVSSATIGIDDTSPAEVIVISANNFEGGFFVNGQLVQMGGTPGSITVPETGQVSFHGVWNTPFTSGNFQRTIYLVEQPTDPTSPPLVSDILDYRVDASEISSATIDGTFVSDVDDNLGTLPAGVNSADVFVEDGQPVPFFGGPGQFNGFLEGQIISDVNIPEPSTLVLLGLGLVSLVCCHLRKPFA
ncbi:MAG: PEP-CTERM sorting domain-containing protein [Planctomycetia bacterium]|nr:PEP-CTERM sorting domain-containing protein [Planctomycetia bacterium]